MRFILLLSVGLIATCGLVYELLAGAIASYLLGDSITQFSIVIGAYLFAMGIGSYLSKFLTGNLLRKFIHIEIAIGVVGGLSSPLLFYMFEQGAHFPIILYGSLTILGILVGAEIPLLMRILKDELSFTDLVSRVLALDYLGALFASICFPLILMPQLGFVKTALLFGLINVGVALFSIYAFFDSKPQIRNLLIEGVLAFTVLLGCFMGSDVIWKDIEQGNFHDRVVLTKATRYQKLTITDADDDIRLFINGNLQFSSRDEYRYHEALVHMAMVRHANPKHILVLGGGDGMAVREILKYASVEDVRLVDLDEGMTDLFSAHPMLTPLNKKSLTDPRVKIIHGDAYQWLDTKPAKADVVIVDFPDPSNFALGKLYSLSFYQALKRVLNDDSVFVVQSTSPLYARRAYWCIVNTLDLAGFSTLPYHAYVPSFGEWGYVLGSMSAIGEAKIVEPRGLKFYSPAVAVQMLSFPPDMARTYGDGVNRLNNQNLVRIFEQEWQKYVTRL